MSGFQTLALREFGKHVCFEYVVNHCLFEYVGVFMCACECVREWCVWESGVCVCFSVCVCVFVRLVCTKVVTRILHMIFHFSAFRRFLCRDPEAAFLFFRWFIFNRGYRKQKQRSTNSNFVDIFEVVSRCRHNIFLVMYLLLLFKHSNSGIYYIESPCIFKRT